MKTIDDTHLMCPRCCKCPVTLDLSKQGQDHNEFTGIWRLLVAFTCPHCGLSDRRLVVKTGMSQEEVSKL